MSGACEFTSIRCLAIADRHPHRSLIDYTLCYDELINSLSFKPLFYTQIKTLEHGNSYSITPLPFLFCLSNFFCDRIGLALRQRSPIWAYIYK